MKYFLTMAIDYDYDHFNQGLKLQHPRESCHSHSHGQWS